MMELLGKMPKKFTIMGKHSKEFFNRRGELKAIRNLQYWPLEDVLIEKYKWEPEKAKELASFLLPMLEFLPEKRATAAEMLKHRWLEDVPSFP
jgi:serine/threonine-protein kinase SRPK3